MWRNFLTVSLLLSLALLPVAQAMGPDASTADAGKVSQDLVIMDCGHVNPDHCVNVDDCAAGNHSNCDSKTKTSLPTLESIINPAVSFYSARQGDRYSSHQTALILRPPRNA